MDAAVVVFHRFRCVLPGLCGQRIIDLGGQHEGMHACRIDGHMGIVHAHDREHIIHGFEHIVHRMLLHDGGFGLLHDEAILPKGRKGAPVEVPGEEAFSRPDGVGAVDDDDVVVVLHLLAKAMPSPTWMWSFSGGFLRTVEMVGKYSLESSMTRPSISQRSTWVTQSWRHTSWPRRRRRRR